MRAVARALAAAVVLAALAGCATAPRGNADTGWISGRLSLRVDASAERSAQSLSAGFELQGNGRAGELRLMSPLGTRLVSARWGAEGAMLTTSDGERRYDHLDDLSRRALGEALPLAALPDWLAGRPWPGAAHLPSADGFEQLGWQVLLTRRNEGWIEAHRSAAPAVFLRLKLDAEP